ncbi:MAG: CBS and ACT domain-containing protein [Desulfobacteraceae bacterium]|nr:CBS and ACT domain-containing protein [Desulfobacteraceae bacterium]MDH3568063.1 CBS and ACT domain-containing protein [Desulfobacteraceae bacterium]
MKVRDFMKTDVISIETKASIMEAQNIMRKKNIKRLPVMKKGNLIGLVTKHMLLEASPSSATSLSVFELNYLLSKMTVDDIMVKDPITIHPDDPVEAAIWLGKKHGISTFPVVKGGKLLGIITEHDIAGVLSEVLGVESEGTRLTVKGLGSKLGELQEIIGVLDDHATPLLSIVTIPRKKKGDWIIVLRVLSSEVEGIVKDLERKGLKITDVN